MRGGAAGREEPRRLPAPRLSRAACRAPVPPSIAPGARPVWAVSRTRPPPQRWTLCPTPAARRRHRAGRRLDKGLSPSGARARQAGRGEAREPVDGRAREPVRRGRAGTAGPGQSCGMPRPTRGPRGQAAAVARSGGARAGLRQDRVRGLSRGSRCEGSHAGGMGHWRQRGRRRRRRRPLEATPLPPSRGVDGGDVRQRGSRAALRRGRDARVRVRAGDRKPVCVWGGGAGMGGGVWAADGQRCGTPTARQHGAGRIQPSAARGTCQRGEDSERAGPRGVGGAGGSRG